MISNNNSINLIFSEHNMLNLLSMNIMKNILNKKN